MEQVLPFTLTAYDNDDNNNDNETYAMSQLHIDGNMEELQKRRKLTVDSGYGDDYTDGSNRMDLLTVDQGMTRTSSLDSISEGNDGDSSFETTSTTNDIIFKTMADKFQNMNATNSFRDNRVIPPSSCEILSSDLSNERTAKTKEKRRRVTPIPNSVTMARPSQGVSQPTTDQASSGRKILFVKEEDQDDVEKYNSENDFICPDLLAATSSYKRLTEKRNSWHGITEGQQIANRHSNCLSKLTKSKSLDRGLGNPRRRKRYANMAIPSISLEDLSLDNNNKRVGLIRQHRVADDFENTSRCCLFGNNFSATNKSTSSSSTSTSSSSNNNLPAWMREAEADMTSSDTGSSYSGDESNQSVDEETLSSKLQIPEMNWEKLNAEKNKTNKLLSERRKVLTKQKNKASSRRRRKLTPSESPSHASLEKLSSFKENAEQWKVTEEDEEEEEEEPMQKL